MRRKTEIQIDTVYQIIKAKDGITTSQLEEASGIRPGKVARIIVGLRRNGLIYGGLDAMTHRFIWRAF